MTTPSVISIAKPITLKTTKEINGPWTATMQIYPDDYVACENYLEIDGEDYLAKVVKQVKSGGKYYFDISLYHNMIELAELTVERFYLTKDVDDILTHILDGTGWASGTVDIDQTVLVSTDRRTSVLEALNLLADKCGGELYFNSKARTVDLKREIGTATELQLRYDKNCTLIEKTEDSTDLVTRIYPYGPDNYSINTTVLDNCEDETVYTASGAGTAAASTVKIQGSQGIEFAFAALNETMIRDLGAGAVVDLSGHDSAKLWIYSDVDNASGVTFGIGEAAYGENTVNSGALVGGCWKEVEIDLSAVADGSKNAIRYIGFKNLTNGAAVVTVDAIRAFSDNIYIDSANKSLYKFNKEYVYNHSARVEKTINEVIIYPSDDAYVYQGAANTNYGSATTLKLRDYGSVDYEAYIKFALTDIPTGATITAAKLVINQVSTQFTSGTGNIKLAGADWAEGTITWNNKPAGGATQATHNLATLGEQEIDITTTVQDWWSGTADNYGLKFELDIDDTNKTVTISSREGTNTPYLKVTFTTDTDPSPIIEAAARQYLAEHDEPKLMYKVKAVDLSKVMANTWEDEEINLGDTVRIYDSELDLNVKVRVKKITKDLLNPENLEIELANRAYSIADTQAKMAKQLKYIMPFDDDERIGYANTIAEGYLGANVNV